MDAEMKRELSDGILVRESGSAIVVEPRTMSACMTRS